MSNRNQSAREKLLQLWDETFELYRRLKTDPKWQFGWDLFRLIVWIIRLLLRLAAELMHP